MNADSLKHIPNIISIMRIILIVPIIWAVWNGEYNLAFILILIAGVSDAVDGFLARYFSWQSKLGALLDPLADKILLISLFVVFSFKGFIPLWLMYIVVARDVIIFLGAIAYQLVTRKLEIRPLFISKINTALQIVLVLLVALILADIQVARGLLDVMIILVVLSTLISGISYIVLWTRLTASTKRKTINKHDYQ
ncbi:MAG: CDP-alcohol phosphatidyltransferase family protein [Thiotrichaceae bacterium]